MPLFIVGGGGDRALCHTKTSQTEHSATVVKCPLDRALCHNSKIPPDRVLCLNSKYPPDRALCHSNKIPPRQSTLPQ